ncbi:IS30 family transposase (plasmid) [Rhizobium grahamii CCGE 502]|uniref:IS30 family transposase n=1 Tax=Rhizobium grahamii CCGE 502 TaxID=990285 RepID=S3I2I3_9HYPH|nr:IS30 family transposase [Rhizobium grahamii CCGE 502]
MERKSRYTVLIKNPSRHSRPIMDKIIRAFSPLPAFARQSFTFDRGTEFAGFRALEEGIGARSWFCDPSAPWQRSRGKRQQAHSPLHARNYRPGRRVTARPDPTCAPSERPTPQMPWLKDAGRGVHGAFAG